MTNEKQIIIDGVVINITSDGKHFTNENGDSFKIYVNQKRSNRKSIQINGNSYYCNRLVAKAFPEICGEWFEGCEVHHINENPSDDAAENLRIISKEEHRYIHKDRIASYGKEFAIPTHQYTMDGAYVATFSSSIEAAEKIGICKSAIRNCLCGISSSAGGFIWTSSETEPPMFIEPLKPIKERFRDAKGKPISQYDLEGNWITNFNSVAEAKECLGKTSNSIGNCLNGRAKTAFGFIWRYAS